MLKGAFGGPGGVCRAPISQTSVVGTYTCSYDLSASLRALRCSVWRSVKEEGVSVPKTAHSSASRGTHGSADLSGDKCT